MQVVYVSQYIDFKNGHWFVDWVQKRASGSLVVKERKFKIHQEATEFFQALNRICLRFQDIKMVYGTRDNKWHAVDKKDRDFRDGVSLERVRIADMQKEVYLKSKRV